MDEEREKESIEERWKVARIFQSITESMTELSTTDYNDEVADEMIEIRKAAERAQAKIYGVAHYTPVRTLEQLREAGEEIPQPAKLIDLVLMAFLVIGGVTFVGGLVSGSEIWKNGALAATSSWILINSRR